MRLRIYSLTLSFFILLPGLASACACGCGVFDVGTGSMLPTGPGGTAWLEYDFMNQGMNWSGGNVASEANNPDKRIRSDFITAGAQYMFNRSWGAELEVPYNDRYFRTSDDAGSGAGVQHSALGDIRISGIYSGFSADMSTGLTFGVKLPTGDYTYTGFDRDTSLGTGSTDLLLGGYHMGSLTARTTWFADGRLDQPVIVQGQYRPGDEIDAALGAYYKAGSVFGIGIISPLLQVIGSQRWRDSGANADSADSGYTRLMISPGVEYHINRVKFYADIELPVYQTVNGNQLVAPVYYKALVAYDF